MERSDNLHLDAAQGWVGLGNPVEAEAELAQVSKPMQGQPEVLKIRWEICASARRWETALEIASRLIASNPEDPLGWIHRSYALHELKRTAEARDNLLRVVDAFPECATMRYNLACYECRLGRLEQAKVWLEKAFGLGDARRMRSMALEDRDLESLWSDIRKR